MINLIDKKRFLNWLVSHVSFSRREVSWILNYLATHEAILDQVHFVEHVDQTPRGILIQSAEITEPMALYIEGRRFVDSDQIFHDMRLNWKKPLYIECILPKSWSNELYLGVLEDNPYHSWNDTMDNEMLNKIDLFFAKEDYEQQVTDLYEQVDQALEEGNQEEFYTLSEKLNQLLSQHNVESK